MSEEPVPNHPFIDPDDHAATVINIDSLLAVLESGYQGASPDDIGSQPRSSSEVCGQELILQAARQMAQFLWAELSELEKATVTRLGGRDE